MRPHILVAAVAATSIAGPALAAVRPEASPRLAQVRAPEVTPAAAHVDAPGTRVVQETQAATFNHGGDPGSPDNSTFLYTSTAPAPYTIRKITATGTLTAVVAGTFASEAALAFGGAGLSTPRGVGFLSNVGSYTTTPANGTYYVVGGVSNSAAIAIEGFETFDDGAGPDSTSALSLAFDDSYGANSFEYSGNTSGDPTFVRPNGFNVPGDVTTSYEAFTFAVGSSGQYQIASGQGFDGVLFVYAGGFDPSLPTANLVAITDEAGNVIRPAGFAALDPALDSLGTGFLDLSLLAGTNYTIVMSGFTGTQAGAYTNVIVGPGTIIVPEPTTLGALAAGALALVRRRRA